MKVAIVAQAEFLVYSVYIVLHRLGPENQIIGDGRVVVALGHHRQNFLLARSETGCIQAFTWLHAVDHSLVHDNQSASRSLDNPYQGIGIGHRLFLNVGLTGHIIRSNQGDVLPLLMGRQENHTYIRVV